MEFITEPCFLIAIGIFASAALTFLCDLFTPDESNLYDFSDF